MRVGWGPDPIGQQMVEAIGIRQAGSGMQVNRRTGRGLVMKGADQVSLMVWVGEK